jgi:phosphatidylglycerol:prolipoprotein diacylglycerol transferase
MEAIPYSRMIFGIIPWYSFLIVLGATLAVILSVREEKRCGLPEDTIIDLALWLLPAGIIGARIYYVVFSWDQFRSNPISVLYIWEGGIAIYGAVIAGFLVIVLFCKKRHLSVLKVCDTIAPGLVLAQAIGRWGNYFNMEAYGEKINNPVFQFFPLAVLIIENGQNVWHMAAFFYESVWDFLIFLVLISLRKKRERKPGDLFAFYLFLYSAGRIVIEDFRMDSLYASNTIRISQLLSLLICTVLLFLTLLRVLKAKKRHSTVLILLFTLQSVFSVAVMLYCFRFPAFCWSSVRSRLSFLGLFSLISILLFIVFYRIVLKKEVPCADNNR